MDYLKIPVHFVQSIEPLDNTERGRLFTAMLIYARDGQIINLPGIEQFIWPTAKLYIDRTRDNKSKLKEDIYHGRKDPLEESRFRSELHR